MKYEITTDGTAKGTVVTVDGKPIENVVRASASVKRTKDETVVNVVVWAAP